MEGQTQYDRTTRKTHFLGVSRTMLYWIPTHHSHVKNGTMRNHTFAMSTAFVHDALIKIIINFTLLKCLEICCSCCSSFHNNLLTLGSWLDSSGSSKLLTWQQRHCHCHPCGWCKRMMNGSCSTSLDLRCSNSWENYQHGNLQWYHSISASGTKRWQIKIKILAELLWCCRCQRFFVQLGIVIKAVLLSTEAVLAVLVMQ